MKKLLILPLAIFALLLSANNSTNAQSLTQDQIKEQLIKEWIRAKEYTVEYLNTMPADKYSFVVQDSIRNFAQQMLHLASANVFLMASATGKAPLPDYSFTLEQRVSAQSKDSVMYFVTRSYDYCVESIKALPISKWGETTKVFNFEMSRFAMLLKTFEHQTHHRGQTTIYIRVAGYKPPQEKLF